MIKKALRKAGNKRKRKETYHKSITERKHISMNNNNNNLYLHITGSTLIFTYLDSATIYGSIHMR